MQVQPRDAEPLDDPQRLLALCAAALRRRPGRQSPGDVAGHRGVDDAPSRPGRRCRGRSSPRSRPGNRRRQCAAPAPRTAGRRRPSPPRQQAGRSYGCRRGQRLVHLRDAHRAAGPAPTPRRPGRWPARPGHPPHQPRPECRRAPHRRTQRAQQDPTVEVRHRIAMEPSISAIFGTACASVMVTPGTKKASLAISMIEMPKIAVKT